MYPAINSKDTHSHDQAKIVKLCTTGCPVVFSYDHMLKSSENVATEIVFSPLYVRKSCFSLKKQVRF